VGLIWLVGYLTSDERIRNQTRLPVLILPIVFGVIYASTQLIPISSLSEVQLGPSLAEEIPVSKGVVGFERNAISIYPLETRMHIASLSIALLAFFLSTQLFPNRRTQIWLFGALAITGLALSFFGLCQKLSWNGHLFWTGPEIINGKPFAAWVNRNNAAGYLNMTFAAALGMLVWSSFRSSRRGEYQYDMLQDGINGGVTETINSYLIQLGQLNVWQVISGTCIIVIAAGVIGSASRGGILSLTAGLFVALIWFLAKGHRKIAVSVFLIFTVPAIALLSWLGLSADVKTRFADAEVANFSESYRFQNWSEASRSLPDIWLTGSGLGTYRYFYRPYQQHSSHGVYKYAENQYLETLIESGVVGLALLLMALILAFAVVLRLSRSKMIGDADGVALVGLVALVTQAAHAFLDYGMMIPSNMLLMATLMGAICGRAVVKMAHGSGAWYFTLPPIRPRMVFVLFALLLIGNGILGWGEISRAAIAENAIKKASALERESASQEDYQRLLKQLLEAIAQRPDDVHLHLHLADIYIRQYQLLTRSMLKKEIPEDQKLTDQQLNQLASLPSLYHQVWRLEKAGQELELDKLHEDPILKQTLIPARSVLLAASSACQWLPQTELYLAYLSVLEEDPQQRVRRLERLCYLTPFEPRYLYNVGKMALSADELDICLFAWRRTYGQTPHTHLRHRILEALDQTYPDLSFGESFFQNDAELLRIAIDDLDGQLGKNHLLEKCLAAIDELVEAEGAYADPDIQFLSAYQQKWESHYDRAAEILAKVILDSPRDVKARTMYVECLILSGELAEAQIQIEKLDQYGVSVPQIKSLKIMLADTSPALENE